MLRTVLCPSSGVLHFTYSKPVYTSLLSHRPYFLTIKPTRCANFSNLFWNKILHVSDSSSLHRQEFFTVHTAVVYVIQLASRIRTFRPDPARKLSTNLYAHNCMVYHCCVYSEKKTYGDGQRNCPENVEFYSKNKFEKLVHIVGFIIRRTQVTLCMKIRERLCTCLQHISLHLDFIFNTDPGQALSILLSVQQEL